MKVQIGNNVEYIAFEDLEPEGEELAYGAFPSNEFLIMTIRLRIRGFSSDIGVSVTVGELIDLQVGLQRLYDTLKYEFLFSNIEDNIEAKFAPTDTGQVVINGYLRNADYSAKLNFRIVTDQTYLPQSIHDLKEITNKYKNNAP